MNFVVTFWLFSFGLAGKNPPSLQETQEMGQDPLKEAMVTHFSFLAWRIPWTKDPGRLQSMRSQGIRHNCSN